MQNENEKLIDENQLTSKKNHENNYYEENVIEQF